jgi:hypothetical protein
MASQRKPVIVRKFSRDWCAGYAGAFSFGQDAAELEILDLGGKVLRIGWEQVKWVCYVRDFPAGEQANPERLLHKRFSIRPRTPGLWLRMTLDRRRGAGGSGGQRPLAVDGAGLLLTPPDTRSNTQRIYVPRQAIQTLEVVSLIGAASRKRARRPAGQRSNRSCFPTYRRFRRTALPFIPGIAQNLRADGKTVRFSCVRTGWVIRVRCAAIPVCERRRESAQAPERISEYGSCLESPRLDRVRNPLETSPARSRKAGFWGPILARFQQSCIGNSSRRSPSA